MRMYLDLIVGQTRFVALLDPPVAECSPPFWPYSLKMDAAWYSLPFETNRFMMDLVANRSATKSKNSPSSATTPCVAAPSPSSATGRASAKTPTPSSSRSAPGSPTAKTSPATARPPSLRSSSGLVFESAVALRKSRDRINGRARPPARARSRPARVTPACAGGPGHRHAEAEAAEHSRREALAR